MLKSERILYFVTRCHDEIFQGYADKKKNFSFLLSALLFSEGTLMCNIKRINQVLVTTIIHFVLHCRTEKKEDNCCQNPV